MTKDDPPRVRRDILISAQRLAQEIDAVEDALETYRDRDLPAFNAWFAARFHEERARLVEAERQLALVVKRHNHVLALAKMHDLALERAYRLVIEEDQVFTRGNPATRRHIREERDRREAFLREDLEREVRARLPEARGAGATEMPAASPDAKVIFRKLVRRLHPDVRGEVACPNELRWQRRTWTLLQTARDAGDVDTLANLYRVTLLRLMDFTELTADDARLAHAWLIRELDTLRADLDGARARPGWNFGCVTDFEHLSVRVRGEFKLDLAAIQTEIDEIHGQHEYLALLANGARGAPTVHPRPRRPRDKVPAANQLSLFD